MLESVKKMVLTLKQKEELNKAIAGYFQSSGFSSTLETFKNYAKLPNDIAKKYSGLLEKKWISVIRLQNKVMELETKLADAEKEIQCGETNKKAGSAADRIPRPPKRETRGEKRNRVSASSEKQKEMAEQRKDRRRPLKTAGLLSNTGNKSGLTCPFTTVPIAPRCLKRQKLSNPRMNILKTTEEMEMEHIGNMRQQARHRIKVNQKSMKKALSSATYRPVQSTTDLTKTCVFNFQTDKRVALKARSITTTVDDTNQHPPSTTWKHGGGVTKPFHLTGQAKRKRAVLDTD